MSRYCLFLVAFTLVTPLLAADEESRATGAIRIEIGENALGDKNEWPAKLPTITETYNEEVFGFFDYPQKYISTGVRGERGHPFYYRATAEVAIPAGKHRLLLRARGATRLTIDGKLVLSTPFAGGDGSGHGAVPTEKAFLDLGPDFRFAPPGNQEKWIAFESPGKKHKVVLETIVGSFVGKAKRRPEFGETVVALSPQGSDRWQLLSPGGRVVPYTDAGWAEYARERMSHYDRVNAQARAAARANHHEYWDHRRDAVREWLKATKDVPVPAGTAVNPVDRFLEETFHRVVKQNQESRGTVDFYRQIAPILESKCNGCHSGPKPRGNLRLDTLANARTGGSNDGSAITPGDPKKSAILSRIRSKDESEQMPPRGDRLTAEQGALLEKWIAEGAHWPEVDATGPFTLAPQAGDLAFLRRASLDTIGLAPSMETIAAFQADKAADKRERWIDRLLADPRCADHETGYWQDVLAENPNILNPTLNNTGPFRWWIHESFRDNKPFDLMVTELIRMEGSVRFGGPAGFGISSQNDAPFAAKGVVIASAFLGVEMKCARCHDSPSHLSTQKDLFELAAMLGAKPQSVPLTSSVPLDKIHEGGRVPLIQVTLKPGTTLQPRWPFPQFVPESVADTLAEDPKKPRDRLAALLTAPQNERFAQVIVNRVWQRLMGRGLVEPVDDWERARVTHRPLLQWLAREWVRSGYDIRNLKRLIMTSKAYQRAIDPALKDTPALFHVRAQKRLGAEQIVDSLFAVTGKPFRVEEMSLDIDGGRDMNNSISLGKPTRSWMLSSTSNERDRPSLSLPRVQAVVDVLQAFGWRGSRQEALSVRDLAPNTLQPAILSNGTMGTWVTRLSDDHGITALALQNQSLDQLIQSLYLRILTRYPDEGELEMHRNYLKAGYSGRVRSAPVWQPPHRPELYVTWSNHLDPRATTVRQEQEAAARVGEPPTQRLDANWRNRLEDVVWALLNSPEFVFTP